MSTEPLKSVILDNGSGIIKLGISGDDLPTCIIPSVVGTPKLPRVMLNSPQHKNYYGREAQLHRGILHLDYPVENGIIKDWENMTELWRYAIENELQLCDLTERPLLITEAPLNPKKNKETMAEIFFEKFNVPSLHIAVQAILALYANGATTGVALDSGDGVTHIVPVYEGYLIPHAMTRTNVAGRSLTSYMQGLLNEAGIRLTSTGDLEIVREIKESLSFCSTSYFKDLQNSSTGAVNFEKDYSLPDGSCITVGAARFQCPELLFQPKLKGYDTPGIHQLINSSLNKCDFDIRKNLFTNIVLSGGTTMIPNIAERLTKELKLLNGDSNIIVHAPEERKYLVWIGGSILGELPSFHDSCVHHQEYDEFGATVIHRKFM